MNQAAPHPPSMIFSKNPLRVPATGSAPASALATATAPATAPRVGVRPVYLAALTWALTLFNTLRAVAYLPTMWAVYASGDSSQHSLWTWCTWPGANATMAA